MKEVSLEKLLESGAHFGHQVQRWNPKVADYLHGVKDGVHVFDLVKTKKGLEETASFLEKIASEGGQIVFVGTKRQAQEIIKEEARKAGMPYVKNRWLGGTITNWSEISLRVKKLVQMKEERERGDYRRYTKKEQVLLDREIAKLERFFEGLVGLEDLPAALFVVDIKREEAAVKEARRKNIPVAAIVDSNCDPSLIDYVIPANDDAIGSLKIIISFIGDAVGEGRKAFLKKQEKEAKKELKKQE